MKTIEVSQPSMVWGEAVILCYNPAIKCRRFAGGLRSSSA